MKKIILLALILSCLLPQLKADDKYEKWAEEVRKEVWSWDYPFLFNYDVPAKYDTCSIVILAWHNDITAGLKKKYKEDEPELSVTKSNRPHYNNTERWVIKINDQRALESYSEINFQQFKKNSYFNLKEEVTSAIGARIIKPDGRIIDVDASRATSLLDEKKTNKGGWPSLNYRWGISWIIL
ncbi:MAG: DUF3857 domain-containing protein [Bacteroidales bacterium]|nr:DUF3857 domain-containing protein [Bacteroidales bacterium]